MFVIVHEIATGSAGFGAGQPQCEADTENPGRNRLGDRPWGCFEQVLLRPRGKAGRQAKCDAEAAGRLIDHDWQLLTGRSRAGKCCQQAPCQSLKL
ncbi:MAG: hypothetical protein RL519_1132, partial [Pseudomonadota bacterium]